MRRSFSAWSVILLLGGGGTGGSFSGIDGFSTNSYHSTLGSSSSNSATAAAAFIRDLRDPTISTTTTMLLLSSAQPYHDRGTGDEDRIRRQQQPYSFSTSNGFAGDSSRKSRRNVTSNNYHNNVNNSKDVRGNISSYLSSRKYTNNNSNNNRRYTNGHHRGGGAGGGGGRWKNDDNGAFHHRQQWLKQASEDILSTTPGTLVKGKWHELVSILKANSKYAKVDPDSPIVMERLVERLVKEIHDGRNAEAAVDIEIYNLLLDAWCCQAMFLRQRPTTKDGVPVIASQRAREMLVSLQENYEQQQQQQIDQTSRRHDDQQMSINNNSTTTTMASLVQPNERSFAMVFDAVLKVEGPTVARRILAWMEFIYRKGRNDLARPGRRYYLRLLQSYANRSMPELAEAFLRHMHGMDEDVDTYCYNVALNAWSKQGGRTAAEHVDRLLEQMTAPKDIITYATAMSAWSKSGMNAHAVARVEGLLRTMEQDGLEPNHVVVNTVMSAWVKSRNPNASNRTAELLEYLESPSSTAKPDLMTYNNHIHALTLSPRNVKEADTLLKSLIERSNRREIYFRPNTYSFNLVISAWAECHDYEAAWNALKLLRQMIHRKDYPDPDTFSFNQVLKALSHSIRPDSARLAEQLLTTMEAGYEANTLRNAKPDVVSYTSVIVALSRSGEANAAERGELILARSQSAKVKPTTTMYNALITLWGKARRGTYGARRAEQLLNEMKVHGVEPNTVSYNTVMDSWSRSGTRCCGNKAEGYLELLLSDKSMKPDKVSFNTCLNAVSRSHSQGKAQRALRLLRRMIKLFPETGARPDVISYTSVLNAAKRSNRSIDQVQRTRNLDTLRHTLHELRESRWDHPNEHSYLTFIQALYGQSDEHVFRETLDDVFELCCADGQMGPQVLSVLKRVAPRDFVEKHNLVDMAWEELPTSWRRHVRITPTHSQMKARYTEVR
jgi:Pentatricopeptide repeat domain